MSYTGSKFLKKTHEKEKKDDCCWILSNLFHICHTARLIQRFDPECPINRKTQSVRSSEYHLGLRWGSTTRSKSSPKDYLNFQKSTTCSPQTTTFCFKCRNPSKPKHSSLRWALPPSVPTSSFAKEISWTQSTHKSIATMWKAASLNPPFQLDKIFSLMSGLSDLELAAPRNNVFVKKGLSCFRGGFIEPKSDHYRI